MDTGCYQAFRQGLADARIAGELLPDRDTLVMVWKYLASAPEGVLEESPVCLCRKIVRWSGISLPLGKLMTCLDIFADVGLLEIRRQHKEIAIYLHRWEGKTDLSQSQTMQQLCALKES